MRNLLLSAGEFLTRVVDGVVESEQITTSMELSDRIAYALQRTLIGLIIVFGVLAIIWIILSLFKFIFNKDVKPKSEVKKAEAPAVPVVTAPVVTAQNNDAVVAAIVAAISAMRNEQGITDGFRVVSFKRGTNKPWNIK